MEPSRQYPCSKLPCDDSSIMASTCNIRTNRKDDNHIFDSSNIRNFESNKSEHISSTLDKSNGDTNLSAHFNQQYPIDIPRQRGEVPLWSMEEDTKLIDMQETIGNKWATIAKYLPGRSETQIKNRFKSLSRASRRLWTQEDDDLLLSLRKAANPKSWEEIMRVFPNRTRNCLRKRYGMLLESKGNRDIPEPGSPRQAIMTRRLKHPLSEAKSSPEYELSESKSKKQRVVGNDVASEKLIKNDIALHNYMRQDKSHGESVYSSNSSNSSGNPISPMKKEEAAPNVVNVDTINVNHLYVMDKEKKIHHASPSHWVPGNSSYQQYPMTSTYPFPHHGYIFQNSFPYQQQSMLQHGYHQPGLPIHPYPYTSPYPMPYRNASQPSNPVYYIQPTNQQQRESSSTPQQTSYPSTPTSQMSANHIPT